MVEGKRGTGGTPTRSDIAEVLQQCAGDLFEKARRKSDYGCLVDLPIVQDRLIVGKGGVISGHQQAVEKAIRLAASTLQGDYRVVRGKVRGQTITVSASQAEAALLASFGLNREPIIEAGPRRRKAREILGLTCGDSTYRGRPGIACPERDLMNILASEMIRQGQVVEGARTEEVAFTFHLKAVHFPECPAGCKVTHDVVTERLDVVRTVRATIDEAAYIVEPWEVNIDGVVCHYECTCGRCSFGAGKSGKVAISFPKLRHGAAMELGYSITFAPDATTRNSFAARPAGLYNNVVVRIVLPQEVCNRDSCRVYGFRQERDWLPHSDRLDLIPSSESDLYAVGVIQPSPHLWLGLNVVDAEALAGSNFWLASMHEKGP